MNSARGVCETRWAGFAGTAALCLLTLGATQLSAQATPFAVEEATIASVHAALDAGTLTCRALVQGYLDRIAAYDQRGPAINAIQHVNTRALAVADSLDTDRRANGRQGSLHCVPVLLKDQVETHDQPTSYGSILFRNWTSHRDATVTRRLREAGAIILAKATMGELAGRFVSSAAGVQRNAYDPTRNPSGSSTGTGSGVAANFGLVGIGEDTGGSIRGPAAVHSLVGLRPTLPLVSRFGMLPANPTQDVLGPMTRTVTDAARVLDVIAGYDTNDPITVYTVGQLPSSYTTALTTNALRDVRIGVLRTTRRAPARADSSLPQDSAARLDSLARAIEADYAAVRSVFERALDDLRALGADIVDSLRVPEVPGRRVGNSFETEEATDAYLRELRNPPVRSLSEWVLSGTINPWRARAVVGYLGKSTADADYLLVVQYRERLRVAVLQLMADHRLDALVYATYDAPPTVIAADVLTNPRPNDAYGRGDNRGLSPSLGFPALTVPAGFSEGTLPVGLEFLGRPFSEPALLGYAFAYEQRTRHRRPPTTTPPLRAAAPRR